MRFLAFFCLVFFAASIAHAVEKPKLRGIKGEDDRVLIEKYQYPWSAIGRINKEVGGFCTGTLIAPKLVLTAAHCVWNKKRNVWLKPHTMHFLAGYRRGSFIAHSTATKFHLSPGYDPKASNKLVNAAKDWALLELKDDLSDQIGLFGIHEVNAKEFAALKKQHTTFIQAGYSQDKAHILSINKDCPMDSYDSRYDIGVHSCDAVNGDSGSPIFYKDENGLPSIAFIHVATTKNGKSRGIAVSAGSIAKHLKILGYLEDARKPRRPKASGE